MRNRPGEPVSGAPFFHYEYTPTVTQAGNTFSNVEAMAHHVSGLVMIYGRFTANATVSASITITLPSGMTARGLNSGGTIPVGIISASDHTYKGRLTFGAAGNTMTSTVSLNLGVTYAFDITVPVAMLG